MRITVRTGGLLSQYLPQEGSGNLAEIEVSAGVTPTDVMNLLGVPPDGSYLVSLNGNAIPKAERAKHQLEEHDTLAIMPPLRGG